MGTFVTLPMNSKIMGSNYDETCCTLFSGDWMSRYLDIFV